MERCEHACALRLLGMVQTIIDVGASRGFFAVVARYARVLGLMSGGADDGA